MVLRKRKCYSLQDHRGKKGWINAEKSNSGEKGKMPLITRPWREGRVERKRKKATVVRKEKCYSLQDHREKQGWSDVVKRKGGEKGKMSID